MAPEWYVLLPAPVVFARVDRKSDVQIIRGSEFGGGRHHLRPQPGRRRVGPCQTARDTLCAE